ncbi:MAG TPA: hypothetical protein VFZ03_18320, partial [Dongiaceae bacterium]
LETRSTALEQSMSAASGRLQEMAQQAANSLHGIMRGQSDEFLNAAEQIGSRIKELQVATVAQRDELIAAAKQAGAYLESALKLQTQEIAATAAGLVQQTHGLSASAKVQAELTGQGLADIVASFEEAAQRQAAHLKDVAAQAAGEATKNLGSESDSVRALFQDLVDRGRQLSDAANSQAVTLGKAAAQAADVAIAMRDALSKQAHEASRAGLQLTERASEASRGLQRQVEDLAGTIEGLINRHAAGLKSAGATAAERAIDLGQTLQRQSDDLQVVLAKTNAATLEIRQNLKAQIDDVGKVAERVAVEAQSIANAFRSDAAALIDASVRATDGAGTLNQTLRKSISDLDTATLTAAAKTTVIRQEVEQQCETLRQAAAEGARQSDQIAQLHLGQAAQLAGAADVARRRLEEVGQSLVQQTESLTSVIDRSLLRQHDLNEQLTQRMGLAGQAAKDGEAQLVALNGSVEGLAQTLKNATIEGARQARDVVQSFRDGGDALTQLAKRAGGQLDDLKTSVTVQLQELSQLSQQVLTLGQSVRSQLQGQTSEFAQAAAAAKASAEAARAESAAASELSGKHSVVLIDAAQKLNKEFQAASVALEDRVSTMTRVAEQAIQRATIVAQSFDKQTSSLRHSLDAATQRTSELGTRFQLQTQEIAKSTQAAMDRLDTLRQTTALTTRDAFLKVAAVMIDELNGLAVDIHNLLEAEVPDDIWKRYRNGDRSIFARRLFKSKDSFVVPAIQQRHQGDEKFQDMVDRYLAKFEDLLKHSATADPESVLSATFITADVGKLYLVMSRSLGRATEH